MSKKQLWSIAGGMVTIIGLLIGVLWSNLASAHGSLVTSQFKNEEADMQVHGELKTKVAVLETDVKYIRAGVERIEGRLGLAPKATP